MPTSRQQDCAETIKRCQIAVERADLSYRKGGSLNALNDASRALATAHSRLYEINAGLVDPTDAGN